MKSFFKLCFVNSFVRGTKKTLKEAVQVIIFHHLTCHYSTIDLGAKWFHNYKAGVRVANLNFYFPSSVGTQFMNGTYFFIFTNSFFFSVTRTLTVILEKILSIMRMRAAERVIKRAMICPSFA